MKCKYHKESEAKYICEKCKQPVCDDCVTDVAGKKVCNNCIQQTLFQPESQRHTKRGGFWTNLFFFCVSLFPGAAHMYMGLFRRGLQLMLGFLGTGFILSYVNFESLAAFLAIPIWFFSFFDSHHLRRKMKSDELVEDIEAFDYNIILKNKMYLGVGIFFLGVLGVLNAFQNAFNANIIIYVIRRALIPLVLIFIGAYMVNKSRKAEKPMEEPMQDDVFKMEDTINAAMEENASKSRISDTIEEAQA